MNEIKPLTSIEPAVKAFLLANYPPLVALDPDAAAALVGGDLAYDPETQDFYIRIDKVYTQADRFEGDFTVDIEVFGVNYLETESRSLDIDALLLGYPHVVEGEDGIVVFDRVSQNTGPDELPWEDDEVSRLGATYVITARRR